MDSAISTRVNPRKRCTAESYSIDAKSQPPRLVRLRLLKRRVRGRALR